MSEPPVRPSFAESVKALRIADPKFPWVQPTSEELDVAAALEETERVHQGSISPDDPDNWMTTWGNCCECGTPWPCPPWTEAQQLAVTFLARGYDRYLSRARDAIVRSNARKRGAA